MIDLAIANCKDHHICFCQKMRLEKAEWTAETTYKAWIEKRDQVYALERERDDLRIMEGHHHSHINRLEAEVARLTAEVASLREVEKAASVVLAKEVDIEFSPGDGHNIYLAGVPHELMNRLRETLAALDKAAP